MSFATINPATGVLVTEYPEMSNAEVVDIINATQLSFFDWQQYSYSERAELMRKTAEILLERKHELAALMTQEMGKTLKSGVGEIEKCAWVCNYYADNTEEFLKPEIIKTEARISKVVFRPIGIVAHHLSSRDWAESTTSSPTHRSQRPRGYGERFSRRSSA